MACTFKEHFLESQNEAMSQQKSLLIQLISAEFQGFIHFERSMHTTTPLRAKRFLIPGILGSVAALFLVLPSHCSAADFSVTSPGFSYTINNLASNPTLTLVRGRTYTFSISTASSHPFKILSAGVANNNIFSGTITYTVPMAVSNYHYICSIHGFGGTIMTVAPPTPPPVQILDISVGTNIVLTSTGTNTLTVHPEYSADLGQTNWFALTVVTNRFNNGTNETICGKPPGDTIFIRIRSEP